VLVLSVVAAAGFARLGVWQLDRAAQKLRLQEAQESRRALPALNGTQLPRDAATAALQLHRAVRLRGQWLSDHTVYLENRQMNGRPGFYALTPLRLPDGAVVLVQRGWLPRDLIDRERIAAPAAPSGDIELGGRMALDPPRLLEFAQAASGPIRQNLTVAGWARESGMPLLPFTVVQEDGQRPISDGLLRQWPVPVADLHKHYGYAFQWFALSALVAGLYVWFQLIRPARAATHAAQT
jgi:surfeit locus 1 family protein